MRSATSPLQVSFTADKSHGLLQGERPRKQPVDDFLRNDIVDSHYDMRRAARWTVLECVHQVASKPEDFIGVAKDETTHFRGNKCTAGFREQFLYEPC